MPNTNTNTSSPKFLTLKEAAAVADREVDTVRKWITGKKLVATRKRPENKRSAYLIKEEDLLAYISANLEQKKEPENTNTNTNTVLDVTRNIESELLVLKNEISHKTAIIDYERQLVMTMKDQLEYERKERQQSRTDLDIAREQIKDLQSKIQELELYKKLYELECQKGTLERLFSKPKPIKLLTNEPTD